MCCVLSFFWKLSKILLFGTIVVYFINHWISTKSHIFEVTALQSIARQYIGKPIDQSYPAIVQRLNKEYSSHISSKLPQLIFVNSGGWMGSVGILYAGMTEYLLIFGTAIKTSGHSGRYWLNITDIVLTGSLRQWKEGSFQSQDFTAGETVVHEWGEAAAVQFDADSWFLEYGRGFIPSSLFFMSADTFSSTHDFISLFYLYKAYVSLLLKEFVSNFDLDKVNIFSN